MEPPEEPGWPFSAAGFDLSQIFSGLGAGGPVNWEIARQIATGLAEVDPETNEPLPDPKVDPGRATALLDLVQAAQTHVAGATGLAEAAAVRAEAVTRAEWARSTLTGLEPVLNALADRLRSGFGAAELLGDISFDPAELAAGNVDPKMMAGLTQALVPMLFGIQAGFLTGLLSHHALGQFDLPLPIAGRPQLLFVMSNIEAFSHDWSIPMGDLGFALALREVAHAAQRSVPWVRDRLVRLATDYVRRYELQPDLLESHFAEAFGDIDFDLSALDPTNPESMQQVFGDLDLPNIDPAEMLAALRTPAQEPVLAELQRFGAILGGYADVVVETIGHPLIPDAARVDEALRRHRVERGGAAEFVDLMLGLQIDREHYEGGRAFCRGVIEREGLDGLNRLWSRESMVPTPNEFAAPGLWLARVELDLDGN
jgi:putative hydrolase